jgi:hypothetical protein
MKEVEVEVEVEGLERASSRGLGDKLQKRDVGVGAGSFEALQGNTNC